MIAGQGRKHCYPMGCCWVHQLLISVAGPMPKNSWLTKNELHVFFECVCVVKKNCLILAFFVSLVCCLFLFSFCNLLLFWNRERTYVWWIGMWEEPVRCQRRENMSKMKHLKHTAWLSLSIFIYCDHRDSPFPDPCSLPGRKWCHKQQVWKLNRVLCLNLVFHTSQRNSHVWSWLILICIFALCEVLLFCWVLKILCVFLMLVLWCVHSLQIFPLQSAAHFPTSLLSASEFRLLHVWGDQRATAPQFSWGALHIGHSMLPWPKKGRRWGRNS